MEHRGGVWMGLAFGGVSSCVAEVVTIPIDVIKTRMQVMSGIKPISARACARQLVQQQGIWSLFRGLSPALLRQSTYGSLRYGMYLPAKQVLVDHLHMKEGMLLRVLSGSIAGCLSSILANPCDLVKVRMQTFGQMGANAQYSGLGSAFVDIVRTEGMLGLWKGVGPTAGRATVLAAVELSSYDTIRRFLVERIALKEGFPLHLSTALSTGFLATKSLKSWKLIRLIIE